MQKYNLPIPILDKDMKPLNLCILDHKINYKRDNTIIITGGKGKRLLPTASVPKPMLKIKNKPIIQRIIEGLKKMILYYCYFCQLSIS